MVKKNQKNKLERVAVYVDGSNFYHKLRDIEIKNITYFGYADFSRYLSGKRKIVAKRYYVGVIRAKDGGKKSKEMQKSQVRLFNHLRSKKEQFSIQRGYLMKNDGTFHEKGVDVKIAVDILVGAYEDMYDTAILISSDTDLIPAIEKARSLGKNIEYIGFSHKPSYGLIKHASKTKLLDVDDVKQFETEYKKQ